jgi:hypothetical protein
VAVAPAPLLAPPGFRLAQQRELRDGAALVGARVLYQWPTDGWVLGRVRRACRRPGFSHVVCYTSSTPLGTAEVDTLLDGASHGPTGRWHLLLPTGGRALRGDSLVRRA